MMRIHVRQCVVTVKTAGITNAPNHEEDTPELRGRQTCLRRDRVGRHLISEFSVRRGEVEERLCIVKRVS